MLQASLEDKAELSLQAVSSSGVNFRPAELVRLYSNHDRFFIVPAKTGLIS
jgi:hypothetical protein